MHENMLIHPLDIFYKIFIIVIMLGLMQTTKQKIFSNKIKYFALNLFAKIPPPPISNNSKQANNSYNSRNRKCPQKKFVFFVQICFVDIFLYP